MTDFAINKFQGAGADPVAATRKIDGTDLEPAISIYDEVFADMLCAIAGARAKLGRSTTTWTPEILDHARKATDAILAASTAKVYGRPLSLHLDGAGSPHIANWGVPIPMPQKT